jgi:hypothetical protein
MEENNKIEKKMMLNNLEDFIKQGRLNQNKLKDQAANNKTLILMMLRLVREYGIATNNYYYSYKTSDFAYDHLSLKLRLKPINIMLYGIGL